MSQELSLQEMQKSWPGSTRSYWIGLVASFLLTSISFVLVYRQILPGNTIIITIAALAFVQAAFQLKYFLHLGEEGKPYWETFIFVFMMVILLIITCGSLWVMHDLNQRTMSHKTYD